MLLKDLKGDRVVTISGGKNKKGFQELDFNQMLSKPKTKKDKEFKEIDFKRMKKNAPVSEQ